MCRDRIAVAFLKSFQPGGPLCCQLISILVLPCFLMLQLQGHGRHTVLMVSRVTCQAVLTSSAVRLTAMW